jgi:L-lactate dehydrogenase (cytochrome)
MVLLFGRDRSLNLAPASISDYRERARKRLPRQLFDYIDGGAYAESTLEKNVANLAELELRQRVMRDVSKIELATEVFGQGIAMPVVLGPVGLAGMFARRGEVQAALAAEKAGIPFCESTVSICGIEELRAATSAPFWFQLYVMRDRGYAKSLLEQAAAAGCPTLLLTVDLPIVGARYRETRNGMTDSVKLTGELVKAIDFALHPGWAWDVGLRGRPHTFGNLEAAVPNAGSPMDFRHWIDDQFDPSVTWKDIEWVRQHYPGRVVVKGVLDPEDARAAVAVGVDGIVVSNHGGRQLDGVPATASALPSIAEAVGDQTTLLVDGGIRSGLDVLRMLALGAKACLIGRAWAFPLAARGESGVAHALTILRRELTVAMALTGTTNVTQVSGEVINAVAIDGSQYPYGIARKRS